jgi:hypothetical protein
MLVIIVVMIIIIITAVITIFNLISVNCVEVGLAIKRAGSISTNLKLGNKALDRKLVCVPGSAPAYTTKIEVCWKWRERRA